MESRGAESAPRSGARRVFLLVLAGVFFVLAILGVALPGLPTTPFLLLTSWCLLRSSPRLHARLRASPLFGPLLHDWAVHHGVRMSVKVTALTLMVGIGCTSIFLLEAALPWRIALGAVLLVGAVVVLRLRTLRE